MNKLPAILLILAASNGVNADFRFSASQAPPMGVDGGISAGVAVGDVDGDGWADVYIANWGGQPSRLYFIRPGRVIERAADSEATSGTAGASGPLLCDFDNDGRPDLFVARQGNRHNDLFWNSDGALQRETAGDLVSDFGDSYSATCGDMDNDGLLDLVVGNSHQPLFLYRNSGERRFTRLETLSAATANMNTWSPLLYDLNGDGQIDVLAPANANQGDVVFLGDGKAGFQASTGVYPDSSESGTLSHALGDIDNDGDLDILVTKNAGFFSNASRGLYRNHDGAYRLDAESVLSAVEGPASGAAFVDIDHDGDLDAYVAMYGARDALFANDGHGRFEKAELPVPFAFAYFSSGHSWHDLDHDGRLDLVLSNWEGLNNFILWNETDAGNWLQVELEGTDSNRPGIGATVWATTNIDGRPLNQRRDVVAGHSFRSQSAPEAVFGFGSATRIDRLRVEWPSGQETVLTGIETNRRLRIREDGTVTELWAFESAHEPSLVDRIAPAYLAGPPEALDQLLAGMEEVSLEDMRGLVIHAARAREARHAVAGSDWILRHYPNAAAGWRLRLTITRFLGLEEEFARAMSQLAEKADHLEGPAELLEALQGEIGYWKKFER